MHEQNNELNETEVTATKAITFSDAEIDVAAVRIQELLSELHELCIKYDMIEFVRVLVPMESDIQVIGSARIGGQNHVQVVLAAGQEGIDIANMIMEYGHESNAVLDINTTEEMENTTSTEE